MVIFFMGGVCYAIELIFVSLNLTHKKESPKRPE